MLVHRGTTRHDQWCSTNQPFESTTHSRESNHKPYVYIYINAIIYVWMLIWMFISRDTCKNKKNWQNQQSVTTNLGQILKRPQSKTGISLVCLQRWNFITTMIWETFNCYDNRWNLPSSQQIRRYRLWPVYLCFFTSEAQKPFLRHNEAG